MATRKIFILLFLWLSASTAYAVTTDNRQEYRQWIAGMKDQPRGPFSQLRWYCNDGTVLPPKEFACEPHGGGHQHGEWSDKTRELREAGYKIANLLAGYDPEVEIIKPDFQDSYNQILIEKYLVAVDDGWILRRALFYRGAIQEQDERDGGRNLLLALSASPEWIGLYYPALRIGVRMIPHGKDTASAQKVRQLSASSSTALSIVSTRSEIATPMSLVCRYR